MATLSECFTHYGAVSRNRRWGWSARSADGKTVVMTFWRDLLNYKTDPVSYGELHPNGPNEWMSRPGNRERIEYLKWARDNLDGILRVVIITAKDTTAVPREIADAHVNDRMIMRIVDFDEATGHFRAELCTV